MLKNLFNKLFISEKKRNEILKDIEFAQKNSQNNISNKNQEDVRDLNAGEILSITLPNFGKQKGFVLKKINFKVGDKIKKGDIVCEIENEDLILELESFAEGKVIYTCQVNQNLTAGIEILKVEGIKN